MKINISARRKARKLALQAIYQWQINNGSSDDLIKQFCRNCNPKKTDIEYFTELLTGIINNTPTLDSNIKTFSNLPITKITPVELAILRLAFYELIFSLNIPYKVVINEALELAKTFGAEESFKYINGILDKAVRKIRKDEIKK